MEDRLEKLGKFLTTNSGQSIYLLFLSQFDQPSHLVIGGNEPASLATCPPDGLTKLPFEPYMMALDILTYLPDDILVKVDRAAMGVSLETRIPLLDHRVVEFAWTLPISMKIKQQKGKQILRHLLYHYVPQSLIDRPKKGFSIPLGKWLRSDLQNWAEELLNPTRLKQEGYLKSDLVWQYWYEHQEEKRNWAGQLWEILMFQLWLESNH